MPISNYKFAIQRTKYERILFNNLSFCYGAVYYLPPISLSTKTLAFIPLTTKLNNK